MAILHRTKLTIKVSAFIMIKKSNTFLQKSQWLSELHTR